jgi:hypothetical protein
VRLSEFWERMAEAFGGGYARSVAADQSLPSLGGHTVEEALADVRDDAPTIKQVWRAVCQDLHVPARLH